MRPRFRPSPWRWPYDCVVIGAGVRLPPNRLLIFRGVVNAIRRVAPQSVIAFNTSPEDTWGGSRALHLRLRGFSFTPRCKNTLAVYNSRKKKEEAMKLKRKYAVVTGAPCVG